METTGKRLKQLRKARNLTQYQVARMLGITNQTLSAYETDSRIPSKKYLRELANLYGTTVEWLTCGEKPGGISVFHNATLQIEGHTLVRVPIISTKVSGKSLDFETDFNNTVFLDLGYLSTNYKDNNLGIIAEDDSMAPFIDQADMVIFNKWEKPLFGEYAVLLYRSRLIVRRLFEDKDFCIASPVNQKYRHLKINRNDYKVIGKLVGVIRSVF
jgi:transcriptional regulator with XRE-family HTH domain